MLTQIGWYIAGGLLLLSMSGPAGFAFVQLLVKYQNLLLVAMLVLFGVLVWLVYRLVIEVRRGRWLS